MERSIERSQKQDLMSPLQISGDASTSSVDHSALRSCGLVYPQQPSKKPNTQAPRNNPRPLPFAVQSEASKSSPVFSVEPTVHCLLSFQAGDSRWAALFHVRLEPLVQLPGSGDRPPGPHLLESPLKLLLALKATSLLLASGLELPPESGVFYLYVSGFI